MSSDEIIRKGLRDNIKSYKAVINLDIGGLYKLGKNVESSILNLMLASNEELLNNRSLAGVNIANEILNFTNTAFVNINNMSTRINSVNAEMKLSCGIVSKITNTLDAHKSKKYGHHIKHTSLIIADKLTVATRHVVQLVNLMSSIPPNNYARIRIITKRAYNTVLQLIQIIQIALNAYTYMMDRIDDIIYSIRI